MHNVDGFFSADEIADNDRLFVDNTGDKVCKHTHIFKSMHVFIGKPF